MAKLDPTKPFFLTVNVMPEDWTAGRRARGDANPEEGIPPSNESLEPGWSVCSQCALGQALNRTFKEQFPNDPVSVWCAEGAIQVEQGAGNPLCGVDDVPAEAPPGTWLEAIMMTEFGQEVERKVNLCPGKMLVWEFNARHRDGDWIRFTAPMALGDATEKYIVRWNWFQAYLLRPIYAAIARVLPWFHRGDFPGSDAAYRDKEEE